jgi:hypothetical protein
VQEKGYYSSSQYSAISNRWAAARLPFEVGETGIGHKLRSVAGRYVNLSDGQIRQAFQEMFQKLATLSDEHIKKSQQN